MASIAASLPGHGPQQGIARRQARFTAHPSCPGRALTQQRGAGQPRHASAEQAGQPPPAGPSHASCNAAPANSQGPQLHKRRRPAVAEPSSGQMPISNTSNAHCGPVTRSNHSGPASIRHPASHSVSAGSTLPIHIDATKVNKSKHVRPKCRTRQVPRRLFLVGDGAVAWRRRVDQAATTAPERPRPSKPAEDCQASSARRRAPKRARRCAWRSAKDYQRERERGRAAKPPRSRTDARGTGTCNSAGAVSQGISAAFSTGSQPQ